MAYGTKATQSGMFKAFSLARKTRDDLKKAMEMDRGFVSSWYGLGQALEAKGDKGEAARSYLA